MLFQLATSLSFQPLLLFFCSILLPFTSSITLSISPPPLIFPSILPLPFFFRFYLYHLCLFYSFHSIITPFFLLSIFASSLPSILFQPLLFHLFYLCLFSSFHSIITHFTSFHSIPTSFPSSLFHVLSSFHSTCHFSSFHSISTPPLLSILPATSLPSILSLPLLFFPFYLPLLFFPIYLCSFSFFHSISASSLPFYPHPLLFFPFYSHLLQFLSFYLCLLSSFPSISAAFLPSILSLFTSFLPFHSILSDSSLSIFSSLFSLSIFSSLFSLSFAFLFSSSTLLVLFPSLPLLLYPIISSSS